MSGGRSRARITVVAALACAALAAAGCSLILDFAPGADSGPPDDGGGDDGGPAVNCDVGEPNDTFETAGALEGSVDAAVCGDGPDFWAFDVNGAQDVTIELTFTASAANDLELQLVRTSGEMAGEIVTISTGTDGNEEIQHSVDFGNLLGAGSYAIAVLGREDTAMNDYQLSLTLTPVNPDGGP